MHMILLGSNITASEAKMHGLVAEVYEPGSVLENSLKVASQLAQLSPGALSLAKEAIRRSMLAILWECTTMYDLLIPIQAMIRVGMTSLNEVCTTQPSAPHTRRRALPRSWRNGHQIGHNDPVPHPNGA